MRYAVVALACGMALLPAGQAAADPSLEEVQADLQERESELAKVIDDFNASQEELKAAEETYEELQEELPELQAVVEESYDSVAQIVSTVYTGGEFAMINSVLGGDPETFADRLGYLQSITELQGDELRHHMDAVNELEERLEEAELLLEQQDEIVNELEEQREEIEAEIAELEDLRSRITPVEEPSYDAPPASGDASVVVQFAYDQLGKPYQYGSAGPNGFDCSGLMKASWAQAGVNLPHNVQMQWNQVSKVSRDQLRPGDIVFYEGMGHNAMYVGDGKIVHAPRTGDVVKVASINIMSIAGYGRP
ncbi:C40 family peptidase [Natronoglycomyces albus]|nr:C40 family peptidase [Natronoglycomyces albus]